MNGKESRSTEYIRGWPSIDDANTDTSKGLSVSTLEEWKKIKNQKKQEARSTERKKKKRKKLEMERREGNIRNIGCIFSEENFQEKLKERDVWLIAEGGLITVCRNGLEDASWKVSSTTDRQPQAFSPETGDWRNRWTAANWKELSLSLSLPLSFLSSRG